MQEVDDEFYERADAHIHLSNDQVTKDLGRGKVSASFMYGLARFNAYISATGFDNRDEMLKSKKETVEYFVEQYTKMLEENIDDYLENFNEYMGIED